MIHQLPYLVLRDNDTAKRSDRYGIRRTDFKPFCDSTSGGSERQNERRLGQDQKITTVTLHYRNYCEPVASIHVLRLQLICYDENCRKLIPTVNGLDPICSHN